MNRIVNSVLAALVLASVAGTARAVVVVIANGNFENPLLDETGSPHPVITANNNVPSWIATDASGQYQAVYDPDAVRLEAAGVDNNWLYQGYAGLASAKQQVTTLANYGAYTLTVTVGRDAAGNIFSFPPVGNGVSTGNAFARLLVDNSVLQDGSSLVAMPG